MSAELVANDLGKRRIRVIPVEPGIQRDAINSDSCLDFRLRGNDGPKRCSESPEYIGYLFHIALVAV